MRLGKDAIRQKDDWLTSAVDGCHWKHELVRSPYRLEERSQAKRTNTLSDYPRKSKHLAIKHEGKPSSSLSRLPSENCTNQSYDREI